MAEITPRWEWRSFGRRFGGAEERLARLAPSVSIAASVLSITPVNAPFQPE